VFKVLLVLHRYLAVSVGLLMALWCLSGFVMMYQQYPTLSDAERLQGLQPLRLAGCCRTEFLPEEGEAADFRIEMQRGAPVLRERGSVPFDLASGTPLRPASQRQILQIAAEHAAGRGIRAKPRWLAEQGVDQWTLLSARPAQAIAHVALDDPAGTELYLNSDTGEVIQDTSRRERILTWLGAIPHWLYPLALRQNGPLWSRIVIWTSVIGFFLVATGLYVGIARWRRRADGRRASPFRGWWYWHHIAGLVFGVLALTWVFSGLLTMNPWGLLEGSDVASRVIPHLQGSPAVAEQRRFLEHASTKLADGEYLRLRSQPFAGKLFVVGDRTDGSTVRMDADGNATPLTEQELRSALANIDPPLSELSLLQTGDAYYYSHKEQRDFPVWRAILGDEQRTRLYVSPVTGELRVIDADARKMRWLERGLHGLDFSGLRKRPLWDIVTLLLLAGVTAVTVTGAWMALQRIRKDLWRS
jgi:uncharacterized iron-regulated membrane protein